VSKGGSEVKETSQQRAMTEFAVNQLQDYTKRWLPLQKRLAAQTVESGAAGSAARKSATGRSNVDTQIAFAGAGEGLEKKLAGTGRNLGAAMTGMADNAATSRGMGQVTANQSVDDAYTETLAALAATGRGERAGVGNSLSRQAAISGDQAAADAQSALAKETAIGETAGSLAGYGLQAAMRPGPKPQGPGMSTNVLGAQADNFVTNPQYGP
jgi:hypothetical protein